MGRLVSIARNGQTETLCQLSEGECRMTDEELKAERREKKKKLKELLAEADAAEVSLHKAVKNAELWRDGLEIIIDKPIQELVEARVNKLIEDIHVEQRRLAAEMKEILDRVTDGLRYVIDRDPSEQ